MTFRCRCDYADDVADYADDDAADDSRFRELMADGAGRLFRVDGFWWGGRRQLMPMMYRRFIFWLMIFWLMIDFWLISWISIYWRVSSIDDNITITSFDFIDADYHFSQHFFDEAEIRCRDVAVRRPARLLMRRCRLRRFLRGSKYFYFLAASILGPFLHCDAADAIIDTLTDELIDDYFSLDGAGAVISSWEDFDVPSLFDEGYRQNIARLMPLLSMSFVPMRFRWFLSSSYSPAPSSII